MALVTASACGRIGFDELAEPAGSEAGVTDGGDGVGATSSTGGVTGSGSAGGMDASTGDVAGGGGGSAGSDGAAGSGGSPLSDAGIGNPRIVGCADGQREGFLSLLTHPAIAACAGGFALPGVVDLVAPACANAAGDDGVIPNGAGCNALDLCAAGWHLCADAAEVAARSPTGCAGAAVGTELVFFAAAQHGPGQGNCGPTGSDDLFGCGTLGEVTHPSCVPLDRWSKTLCGMLANPWVCGGSSVTEALDVVKPGPAAGGVLCCRS